MAAAANDNSYGAAAYGLVVAALLDLIESGRIDAPAQQLAETAMGVVDGLADAGTIEGAAREQARAAIESFRQQVGSAAGEAS
jgi:hypothetical protein